MEARLHWLDHRIPPPLVFALVGLAMWWTRGFPGEIVMGAMVRITLAVIIASAGFALGLAAVIAFLRARTTVDPYRPETASSLVTAGVYHLTRNPMYLGLAVVLLAWAVYLAACAAFAGPPLFAAYITCFQIIPEERVLARKFGAAFTAYRNKVRRWF